MAKTMIIPDELVPAVAEMLRRWDAGQEPVTVERILQMLSEPGGDGCPRHLYQSQHPGWWGITYGAQFEITDTMAKATIATGLLGPAYPDQPHLQVFKLASLHDPGPRLRKGKR